MIPLLLFFALLLIGCKLCRSGEWNRDFLSRKQMRSVRGFCALGVILHHIAQKTCASWLPAQYIVHGMDGFLNLGYDFVAVFLFASGYGLYKSARNKADYFKGYFRRRFLPVLLAYGVACLIYTLVKGIPSTYNWYIVAILYLYLMFYLFFRKGGNDTLSLVLLCASVVLYCVFCDFSVYGTWWYNTVGIFPLGILFARQEERITAFARRFYLPLLVLLGAGMAAAATAAVHLNDYYYTLLSEKAWLGCRTAIVSLQFVAGCCFTGLVLLVGMKVKIGNPVLDFLGGISLELYLIHGLFIQLFGYCYFNESVKPLYYIRNVPLYTAVVLMCGIASAAALHWLFGKILQACDHIAKNSPATLAVAKKDGRRVLCGLGIALAAIVVISGILSAVKRPGRRAAAEAYREGHITYATVGDSRMAAYLTGEGETALVILRGSEDPAPTLTLRALADDLASDYRVAVLDGFGTGFSDHAGTERSAENIVSEVHAALEELGIAGQYILMPWEDAAPWAMLYVQQYKEEVKAIVPVDAEIWQAKQAEISFKGSSLPDYCRSCTRDGFFSHALARVSDVTGLNIYLWPLRQQIYEGTFSSEELPAVQHILSRQAYSGDSVDMSRHLADNLMYVSMQKYPREVFVLDILSSDRIEEYKEMNLPLTAVCEMQCAAKKKHRSVTVTDAEYCAYFSPETLHKILLENLPE